MDFTTGALQTALHGWAATTEVRARAEAHNISFDEHVGPKRLATIESDLAAISTADEMRRALIDYYCERVRVSSGIPATFQPENLAASSGYISEEQKLIRLEDLREPLSKIGTTAEFLQEKLAQGPKGKAFLDRFMEEWTTRPDILRNPCAWAAFKDELLPDLAAPDWPERLRDTLGLSHYDPKGAPIPVALLEYEAGDVIGQAVALGAAQPFVIPTTFDSAPNPQFFPTPIGFKFGCPMALRQIYSDDDLVAELIHPKLIYGTQHLKRIGYIRTPTPIIDLKEMRDNHLLAVRVSSVRDDYGMEL